MLSRALRDFSWLSVLVGLFEMAHRFKVGQLVRTRGRNADRSSGIYEIVRLLPPTPRWHPTVSRQRRRRRACARGARNRDSVRLSPVAPNPLPSRQSGCVFTLREPHAEHRRRSDTSGTGKLSGKLSTLIEPE